MQNFIYNGFINILKPSGPSSGDIVARIKRLTGGAKCGHLGTLDPLAAGVLPVAIGKATKLFNHLALKRKKYRAVFTFGNQTDTGDSEGIIIQTGKIPSENEVQGIIPLFIGKILQTPHIYSAIKIGGRKACDMARQGIDVQIKSREIEIYNLKLISVAENNFIFDIECSAGTYIRSLCIDIAKKLDTVACMTMLIRLSSGVFNINNSITLEEAKEETDISKLITPITYPLGYMESVILDDKYYKEVNNGVKIKYYAKDSNEILVYCKSEFFGIGSIKNNILKVDTYLRQND